MSRINCLSLTYLLTYLFVYVYTVALLLDVLYLFTCFEMLGFSVYEMGWYYYIGSAFGGMSEWGF